MRTGCVDTVLTACRGHISPTVSGGELRLVPQPSFSFDYSDVRLMGVTSRPLHNLGSADGQVIVLPGVSWVPAGKSRQQRRRRRRARSSTASPGCCSTPRLLVSSCHRVQMIRPSRRRCCSLLRLLQLSDACYVQLHNVPLRLACRTTTSASSPPPLLFPLALSHPSLVALVLP